MYSHLKRNYQVKFLFQVKLFGQLQSLAVAFGQGFRVGIAIVANGIQSGFFQLPNIISQTAAKVGNGGKPVHIGKLDQRKGKRSIMDVFFAVLGGPISSLCDGHGLFLFCGLLCLFCD